MINKAKLIWLKSACDNQYAQIRQTFIFDNSGNANIQIYSDSEYTLYINGQLVGTGQYRSFENVMVFDEYDISGFVRGGENVIDIVAYHQGENSLNYKSRTAAAAFAVYNGDTLYAISDENTDIRLHPYYQSGPIEKNTIQLGFTYHYDASLEETEWEKANTVEKVGEFVKRPIKKLDYLPINQGKIKTQGFLIRKGKGTPAEQMQKDFLSFAEYNEVFQNGKIKYNSDGVYFVIDLGEECAGYFDMSLTANEKTAIDIGYGEHLDDMRVRTSVGGRNFAMRYICKDGKQSFSGYFRRMAGRYISIHITNMKADVEFHRLGLIPVMYPIDRISNFKCEDYLFNRLYEKSVKTMRMCMHEHYEDCPWREQALYAYDSYIQMLCGYYAFGEYDFARASLKLLADSQHDDGLLEMCAPSEFHLNIPAFSLTWVISLEKYVLYSGDIDFGKQMLSVAKKILDAFEICDNLVVLQVGAEYFHFYEWTDMMHHMDDVKYAPENITDAPINMFYIMADEAYNKLADWCGEKAYGIDAEKIKRRVFEVFADTESGLIQTFKDKQIYHEMVQGMAVCTGISTDQRIAQALISHDKRLIENSLSTSLFKYEALLSYGDEYMEAVLEDIADVWGKMLFAGADTIWETSLGADDFEYAGSLCHAWSAVPVYLWYKYYIGFEPETPGFETYHHNPKKVGNMGTISADLYMPDKTEMEVI